MKFDSRVIYWGLEEVNIKNWKLKQNIVIRKIAKGITHARPKTSEDEHILMTYGAF